MNTTADKGESIAIMRLKPVRLNVLAADISKVLTDAIIVPINSGGAWFGAMDRIIQSVAGNQFHLQVRAALPLTDGETVVARQTSPHQGGFRNVVFVIDDLQRPLREVILAGLKAAESAGFHKVHLPTMRMGVMLGAVEKSVQEAVDEMAAGVRAFLESYPESVDEITFVVYKDPSTVTMLEQAFNTPA